MSNQPFRVQLRRFLKRHEWNPLMWAAIVFLLLLALGAGSARSVVAGAGVSGMASLYILLWKWAYKRACHDWQLRSLWAFSAVTLWTVFIETSRWMRYERTDWRIWLIGLAVAAVIIGPIAYWHEIPDPESDSDEGS